MICIAGMHRSGTSLVAHLLHRAGMYLGGTSDMMRVKPDNEEGFWENVQFVRINDEILGELGGAWDYPPTWGANGIEPLKEDATRLLASFDGREPWGWKDPRNSLTLPFWKSLAPQLKVVVCLRNPLEVAESLHRRNLISHTLGLALWKKYNESILGFTSPAERIITHYESHLQNPEVESQRLLNFLGLPALENAGAIAKVKLRHVRFTSQDLRETRGAAGVFDVYAQLCREAGR